LGKGQNFESARCEAGAALDWGGGQAMLAVTQTTRLIPWVIVGLMLLGALLHLFGPAELETDELVAIGLLIIGLIWLQVWLRRRGV
jgi:hypothetical protein